MSKKILSQKIPNNFFNEYINKKKCCCDSNDENYLKIVPNEFDDLFMELYKHLLYNITSIKTLNNINTILSLIKDTDNIITTFCKIENIYSEYGDDKIFYACIPFYIDFNKIEKIRVSDGINFFELVNINKDTSIEKIYLICSKLIKKFSEYLIN